MSSISTNKNYNNKNYLNSLTNNNYGYNYSNISEQSILTNTEINKKIKENEDAEYAKLQNSKYILYIYLIFFLCCLELDEMVNYINNMNM